MASETTDFEPSSGWEDEVDQKNLVDVANQSVSLQTIFAKYDVSLERTYSTTGWDFRCSCPFDDHNDKTPSFGYNQNMGIFNCFGCHRGGKAVEFISYKEKRPRIVVAREIIGKYSGKEIFHNSIFDFERLQELLFDFADTIRLFIIKHNCSDAIEYTKSVTWSLDVYLQKYVPSNSIVLEELEVRIALLKEQLELYGDPE